MNKIIFKDLSVEHLVKKSLKHSYINIDANAKITLKTSSKSTLYAHTLLSEKEGWIRKQLLKIKSRPIHKISVEDEVMLFGEVHSIDSQEVSYLRDSLNNIKTEETLKISKFYDKFYLKLSKEYLPLRVEYYANIMNLSWSELKYRKMKSRWGSCSSKGVLTFNTKLMKVKKEFIDYVVVHELAHLVHMNHSKEFHSLVDRYIPNSKLLRREFKSTYYE